MEGLLRDPLMGVQQPWRRQSSPGAGPAERRGKSPFACCVRIPLRSRLHGCSQRPRRWRCQRAAAASGRPPRWLPRATSRVSWVPRRPTEPGGPCIPRHFLTSLVVMGGLPESRVGRWVAASWRAQAARSVLCVIGGEFLFFSWLHASESGSWLLVKMSRRNTKAGPRQTPSVRPAGDLS